MKYSIVNIRKGKGNRSNIIYAKLVDENGELIISATLDYIIERLKEMI